jgi:hypothetical protein
MFPLFCPLSTVSEASSQLSLPLDCKYTTTTVYTLVKQKMFSNRIAAAGRISPTTPHPAITFETTDYR